MKDNEHSGNDVLAQVADTVRLLSADMVQRANSGHPGMPMGMADCAAVLYSRFLRHDPARPDWPGRDRFILSAGHGSALLYSLLYLCGYPLSREDLGNFRQWDSPTPGHPERWCLPGVETTTGPLGQGVGNAVGLALAQKLLAARLGGGDFNPVDFRVFAIASDGDMMEGITSEAASLAGHLQLGNLVVIYDDNHISIEGPTTLAFSEDAGARFAAYGWQVQHIDGHDHDAIVAALERALAERRRPSLICARTHIAYKSPGKQDSASAHGAPLGAEELQALKRSLGFPEEAEFHVPEQVQEFFSGLRPGWQEGRQKWEQDLAAWQERHPDRASLYRRLLGPELPAELLDALLPAAGTEAGATRALSGQVLQRAAELLPGLVGGSADLAPSNKTEIKGSSSVTAGDFSGRNLHFGVREHGMGAIMNGMALSGGLIPYGGTFLVFSDYLKPAIRLAALMELGVIYVFTHDSIFVGEDGPTHQPIEQLAGLRAIPGLVVYRPADAAETAAAWTVALQRRTGPTALILSRQKLPYLERPADFQPGLMLQGAYVLVRERAGQQALVIASGSEAHLAAAAASALGIRAVSMPSVELFLELDEAQRAAIVPPGWKTAVLEASRDPGWWRFCGSQGLVMGMERFGASAPAGVLAEKFGFTAEQVTRRLEGWLQA